MSTNEKEAAMSERPTPRVDEAEKKRIGWEVRKIASVSGGPPMAGDDTPPKRGWEVARDLERQLAERDAQLAAMAGLAEYWKTWERETGIKRDEAVRLYLRSTKERDEARGQLAEARTALELIADSHDAPQNDEYAREALARIDANRPAHPPTVGCGEGSNHTEL